MNWEDTILYKNASVRTQAKVTWDTAFKAGIREVVEWIEQNKLYALVPCPQEFVIMWDNWQAFLKEKGIEEGK